MRTPNVQPNPDDYEFSLGLSNDYYHINANNNNNNHNNNHRKFPFFHELQRFSIIFNNLCVLNIFQ